MYGSISLLTIQTHPEKPKTHMQYDKIEDYINVKQSTACTGLLKQDLSLRKYVSKQLFVLNKRKHHRKTYTKRPLLELYRDDQSINNYTHLNRG